MLNIKSANIPKPCSQSWQQMTPVTNGRHCESCCKTVVDFTKMTNNEVISYLSYNAKVCGKFDKQQLINVNSQLDFEDKHVLRWLKGWAVVADLVGSLPAFKVSAQTIAPIQVPIDTQKHDVRNFPLGKIAVSSVNKTRKISGHVTSDADNLPVVGAAITIPSVGSVWTNINGNFSIDVPFSTTQFKISYVSCESKIVFIDPNTDNYPVIIHEKSQLSGDVFVVRQSFIKRLYYRFIKRPIRKIFHS